MKAQSNTATTKRSNAILEKAMQESGVIEGKAPTKAQRDAVSNATTRIGKAPQRKQKAAKGITRDYSAQGKRDAQKMMATERAADVERVKILEDLSHFAQYGFGPQTGKKRKFHDTTETYFRGWAEVRDDPKHPENKASLGVRYAEARRVCHAFCMEGVLKDWPKGSTMKVLRGEGSYHNKVGKLPTMTEQSGNRKPRQTNGNNAGANTKKPTLAEVQDQTQRISIIAQYKEKELGEIAANLPESQLPTMAAALALRCIASKDKALNTLGKKIQQMLKDVKTDEGKQAKAA